MNSAYNFPGQVVPVTGAGSGMGLATAKAFAPAGASVVLADINEAAAHKASEVSNAAGHRTIAVDCDVADEQQAAAMVERTVAEFGRLDMAYSNAGSSVRRAMRLTKRPRLLSLIQAPGDVMTTTKAGAGRAQSRRRYRTPRSCE
jgi:NAD(P)-dependent dehydrogenase (short-subunit alcohol dehydrogenase family)